jgi:predicted amino acid-binding ACT domain protein
MREKYSWSAGCLARDRAGICLVISSATRNVSLDVNVLMVNFVMMRKVVSLWLSVLANMKGKQFEQERMLMLETVKLGIAL